MTGLLALARLEWRRGAAANVGAALMVVVALQLSHTLGEVGGKTPLEMAESANQLAGQGLGMTFAFACGVGRLTPGVRDGTEAQWDGLPVSRSVRWAVKVIMGLLPVLAVATAMCGRSTLLLLAAPTFGPYALAPVLPQAIASVFVGSLVAYGAGLTLGWFGVFAWGCALFVGIGGAIAARLVPTLAPWLPTSEDWYTLPPPDVALPLHLGPLLGATAAAVILTLTAALPFQGPGAWIMAGAARVGRAARWVGLGTLALMLLLLLPLSAGLAAWTGMEGVGTFDTTQVGPDVVLLDPTSAPAQALVDALPAEADAAWQRFGVATPRGLTLELTAGSVGHAGFTTSRKIRLSPRAGVTALRHELAHAAARARVRGRTVDDHSRLLAEGLATVFELEGDTAAAEARWREAATASTFGEASLTALLDPESFVAARDDATFYAFSFTWVDHLRQTVGWDTTLRFHDALALGPTERERDALAPWEEAARSAGFDLAAVTGGWRATLAAEAVTRVPMEVIAVEAGPTLRVSSGVDLCRFRPRRSGDVNTIAPVLVTDGRCAAPPGSDRDGTIGVQLGVRMDQTAVFAPWEELRAP